MPLEHKVFKFEGKVICDYDPEAGILKLSSLLFTKSELEFLADSVKDRPANSGLGISKMPLGTRVFYGLREIRPLIYEEDELG